MANFYVATNGNDGNAGTIGSPKLTVAAALNASAVNDTVYIRRGVYTDQWPTTKVFGRQIAAYQGEDVTIDCQGARNYVATGQLNGTGVTVTALGLRLRDLKFVNYNLAAFEVGVPPNHNASSQFDVVNCFFKPATNVGTFSQDISNAVGGTGDCNILSCTFVNHEAGLVGADFYDFLNNAFKGNTYNVESVIGTNTDTINGLFVNGEKDYNAWPGNTETHGVNTTGSPIAFNNEGAGDYSLATGSGLRGAGKYGANIGASFNPRVYFDNVFSDFALSSGTNDETYYDTGLSQPGVDGPVNAGPAAFSAGAWRIDNISEPGATSARVHLGQVTLPSNSRVTIAGWAALEDTTFSSGSKLVIDNSAGTGTREIQISINGNAKQLVSKVTNVNTDASTIDFYLTIRTDGQ